MSVCIIHPDAYCDVVENLNSDRNLYLRPPTYTLSSRVCVYKKKRCENKIYRRKNREHKVVCGCESVLPPVLLLHSLSLSHIQTYAALFYTHALGCNLNLCRAPPLCRSEANTHCRISASVCSVRISRHAQNTRSARGVSVFAETNDSRSHTQTRLNSKHAAGCTCVCH